MRPLASCPARSGLLAAPAPLRACHSITQWRVKHDLRRARAAHVSSAPATPATAYSAVSAVDVDALDAGAGWPAHPLFEWLISNGGSAHPLLVVTDDAPCGCRGVVARQDIRRSSCQPLSDTPSVEGCSSAPLIAVPEQLCMTTDDALQLLSAAIAAADPGATGFWHQAARLVGLQQGQAALQQRLRQVQPPMLLALLLAQQRRLGVQSFWHPYISELPSRPPCAWFPAVEHSLSLTLDTSAQQGRPSPPGPTSPPGLQLDSSTLEAAASAVAAKCSAAADVFGTALGGISATEVAWAYGQLVSRAFATGGSPAGLALLPVIDMLNHAAGAAVPVCWLGDEAGDGDAQEHRAGSGGSTGSSAGSCWCVWHQQLTDWQAGADGSLAASSSSSIKHGGSGSGAVVCESEVESVREEGGAAAEEGVPAGDPVILAAGQELYISYMSSCDAAAALLSFGFVPPELQQA